MVTGIRTIVSGVAAMVERRTELDRRYKRKKKMKKLKAKLAKATANKDGREREKVLSRIKVLSPWWKEPTAAAQS
jgi:hypothetical protein